MRQSKKFNVAMRTVFPRRGPFGNFVRSFFPSLQDVDGTSVAFTWTSTGDFKTKFTSCRKGIQKWYSRTSPRRGKKSTLFNATWDNKLRLQGTAFWNEYRRPTSL